MKVICGIYKITSPTGKIYIGQSINIYKRWKSYKKLRCESQPKIYNSLKKHGVYNHQFEIIHISNKNDLSNLELYYIDLYESYSSLSGLNCDRTIESKLASYRLKHNIKRIEKERLKRKNIYNKNYHKIKTDSLIAYKKSLQYIIDLQNMKCVFTGKFGFIENHPPIKTTDKCIYPSDIPF